MSKDGPDRVSLALAVWNCVAIPSIFYGIESVRVDDGTIETLESIQASFGKSVLNVRRSTANVFPRCELGLKSMRHRIYEHKINFLINSKL